MENGRRKREDGKWKMENGRGKPPISIHQTEIGLRLCSILSNSGANGPDLEPLSDAGWDEVLRQAGRHGVTPWLYLRLRDAGSDWAAPARVEQGLQAAYYRGIGRNARLYHSLLEVLSVLQRANIPVIALKGVHLAELVYRNIALRQMGDADLLVRKTDLARAEEKLRDLGYHPARPFWIEAICATSHHLPPFTRDGAVNIELHWTIARPTAPYNIDLDGLWERAQPATIDDIEILTLSPEDLLLHLCLHTSFQHRFAIGLRALCDISETVRYYRDDMDWEQVQLRACQWGAGKCVYLTLRLARELVGADVPADVLSALEPDDLDPGFVTWGREQTLTQRGSAVPLSSNLVRIWEADGLRGKVASFLKFTFPSREAMATMYPASPSSKRIYLYYPVRLTDVLLRYGRTAWRLLRHDERAMASAGREDSGNALVDWLGSP